MFSERERQLIRRLAGEVAQCAHSQENVDKKKRWIEHNAMRSREPMVLAYFERSWEEIIPPETLETQSPLLREVELELRKKLYQHRYVKDDAVVEDVYRMRAVYDDHFDWGMHPQRRETGTRGGTYEVVPVITCEEDVALLKSKCHDWDFDDAETQRRLDALNEVFGDLLPVRPSIPFYTSSIIFQLVPLYGLAELMTDLILEPERIHTIMTFMTDSLLHAFQRLEKEGRIISNNNGIFLPSGSFGFSDELKQEDQGPFLLSDLWGFADTQEFTDVSAEMWREFVFPYQKKLLKQFGLVYYGCCEKMDQKLDDILQLPNLRKVSVSPWTDIHLAAEKIGSKAIYCRKPNPSQVIYGFHPDQTREDLTQLKQTAGDCYLEVVLKDLHTCNGHPEHVLQWVELAKSTLRA